MRLKSYHQDLVKRSLLTSINLFYMHRWIWSKVPCGQTMRRQFLIQQVISTAHQGAITVVYSYSSDLNEKEQEPTTHNVCISLIIVSTRFLRVVDRFNSLLVSAFITPGGTVMLLLHNGRAPEESVRSFFTEASELFAKHIMNPFAIIGTFILI